MLAILFSGISLMALLFLQKPRWVFILLGLGAFAGLVAGFWSGSRGAIFTIPFMLLLLLPPLWRRQRTKEISLFGLYAAVALALFLFDSGGSKVRSENFVSGLLEDSKDQSVSVRKTLLFMSLGMFREHPLLGVGNSGWDREISRAMQPNETGSILQQSYNQAHNQYLNDFAKGGIVRGVAGISLLAVPAFLFLRSKPFAGDGNSLAALAGLITCLCYALFCLTESVMSLSLTATIYTLLVCYLIAATKQLEAESPESTHLLMSTWLVDVERQLAAQATEPPSSR